MKINSRLIFWLGVIALLVAGFMMMGCNAQRKLNKSAVKVAQNKQATQVFFDEYSLTHNIEEGKVVYVPGETIVKDSIIRDTIYLVGKGQTIREKHFVNSLRVDTVFQDSKEIQAIVSIIKHKNTDLAATIDSLNIQILDVTKVGKEWKREAWVFRGICIAIIIFFAARLFIKVIRPLLKLYFKI